jgi:3-oxoacyl-[acyl-carrier-protein] synthase-3
MYKLAQQRFPTDTPIIVPHQANARLLEKFQTKIKQKVIITGDRMGNSSTASPAHALDVAFKEGHVQPGTTIYMIHFGSTLSWALNVYKHTS